jgi:oligopeptide transport system substrate-binding protein
MIYSQYALKIKNILKKRQRRFPKLYREEILAKAFMHTLVSVETGFLAKRSMKILARLISIQSSMRQKASLKMGDLASRELQIKLLQLRIDGVSVLGITIGVHLVHQKELLEEKHIFRALSSVLLAIKVIPGSFYSCHDEKGSFSFYYLEIEKLRGKDISPADAALLRKMLPQELQKSIQPLTYALLYRYNEEEIYKSVVLLAKELREVNDLPQVIISFQSQTGDLLCFSVVIARVRKNEALVPEQFGDAVPSSVQLVVKRTFPLEALSKNYLKEAVIVSFEVDCSLFLTKNWSIDLRQARSYVAKVVEQIFGPFRDYYGGLLSQQDKHLERIKHHLRGKYEHFYPLMKELFHSLQPALVQALIPPTVAKRLFFFLASLVEKEPPLEGFLVKERRDQTSGCLLIKTRSLECQESFLKEVKKIQQETYSSKGYSCLEFEGAHYLCFVDLNPLGKDVIQGLIHHLQQEKLPNLKIREDKILRINFQTGDPPSLNPQVGIDQSCRCLGKALFEGLTRLSPEGVPEPAGAKEIKVSSCHKIYTFLLREHYWSNGEEVTAYDFENTWKKAIAPSSNCLRSDLFYVIKNARDVHRKLKPLSELKVKALNAKTLVVELEYPAFHFLRLIAQPIFSPLYRGEEEPNHFNGPFLLKEWKRDLSLRLTSNPYYWDKKNVDLKGITISMVTDIPQVSGLFEQGAVDWLGEPFSALISNERIAGQEEGDWKKERVDQMYWLYLNTRVFPFNSINIRKAFAYAINRKDIIYACQGQRCSFGSFLIQEEQWEENIPLAEAFLAAGLEELKITKDQLNQIKLFYGSTVDEGKLVGMLQAQWRSALGIEVDIVRIEWNRLSYLLDKREYQAATCYRSSPYFYSKSYLELFRESGNLYNSSQWEDPHYKALIDKGLQCVQVNEREKLLEEAEQILWQHMPVIPIFSPDYRYLLSKRIKRVCIASNGDVDLKWVVTCGG